jgi:hypothetical protein
MLADPSVPLDALVATDPLLAMNAPLAFRLTQRPNLVPATDRSRMGSVRGVRNTRWAGAVARSTPPVQAAAHQAAFDADRPALHVGVKTRGGSRQALLRDAR